jgi:hypothetical protein
MLRYYVTVKVIMEYGKHVVRDMWKIRFMLPLEDEP